MVVLSLVLGLSEQDDFANIPDLQNPGTQQNQNAQGDKRYEHGRGLRQRQQRQRRRHGEATCLTRPRLLDEVVVSSADAGVGGEVLQLVFCPLTTSVVSLGSMKGPSWDHSGSSLLPSMLVLAWSKPRLLGPISLLAFLCRPSIFHLCPLPQPRNPCFSGGWLPAGGKAVNTAPVPGQTPHDESDRRTEPRSSVSDLVNSLTSEMLMLSPGSEEDEAHEGCSRENLGRIQFSVGYNFQESTLTVKVMKAQELPAKDFSGTSDPFVKIYLLPDKKHKLETKVKRKNLNPHWNETFLFEGFPYEKVVQRVLYLQVLDYDRFSRNDPIGEVSIPLNKVDLTQMQTFWKDLKPCSDGSGSRGELLLSLCYNPSANSIIVNIIKARNLKAMDIGGTSDPYVKVWLMYKDKRVEKKKTVTKKRNLNPIFNESFAFDIPTEKLRETTIIITVMDKDKLSRNDVIGKIYLSWKSGPGEVKHWKDMIARPRQPVAQWHQLKA
ncbi:hypothetical protein STEG23_018135 [Scotinomys teguina]